MIPLSQQLAFLSRAIRTARTPEDRETLESIREVVEMRANCDSVTREIRNGFRTVSSRFERKCPRCENLYSAALEECPICRVVLVANEKFSPAVKASGVTK
jgi:hypothetical protein